MQSRIPSLIAVARTIPVSTDEWLETAVRCDYATFFHTPLWSGIISCYTKGKYSPSPVKVTFRDGAEAVLCLTKRRRPFGMISCLSSPEGTYGGWVSAGPLQNEHAAALRDRMLTCSDLVWRENPFDPCMQSLELPGRPEFTHVLDLRTGVTKLYEQTTHAHRKALKKAQRAGITVHRAQSYEEWAVYFDMYRETVQRWKQRSLRVAGTYRRELFDLIYKSVPGSSGLWLASKDNRIIAGILCFYWNHHAVAWHAASMHEHFADRPNNLLYWTIACEAAKAGYWWFDFNPSDNFPGVVAFKDQFGASRLQCRRVEKKSMFRAIASRSLRRVRRKFFGAG